MQEGFNFQFPPNIPKIHSEIKDGACDTILTQQVGRVPEQRDVDVAGLAGYGGDVVVAGRQPVVGVEAGDKAAGGVVLATLATSVAGVGQGGTEHSVTVQHLHSYIVYHLHSCIVQLYNTSTVTLYNTLYSFIVQLYNTSQ